MEVGFTFEFVKGTERASTGTHYTPDELVTPLIRHSLDYVIAEKLKQAIEEHKESSGRDLSQLKEEALFLHCRV